MTRYITFTDQQAAAIPDVLYVDIKPPAEKLYLGVMLVNNEPQPLYQTAEGVKILHCPYPTGASLGVYETFAVVDGVVRYKALETEDLPWQFPIELPTENIRLWFTIVHTEVAKHEGEYKWKISIQEQKR